MKIKTRYWLAIERLDNFLHNYKATKFSKWLCDKLDLWYMSGEGSWVIMSGEAGMEENLKRYIAKYGNGDAVIKYYDDEETTD